MYKDNFKKLVENSIANLIERGLLHQSVQYRTNVGLVKVSEGGNYSTIHSGTPKQVHAFLEGINYLDMM